MSGPSTRHHWEARQRQTIPRQFVAEHLVVWRCVVLLDECLQNRVVIEGVIADLDESARELVMLCGKWECGLVSLTEFEDECYVF